MERVRVLAVESGAEGNGQFWVSTRGLAVRIAAGLGGARLGAMAGVVDEAGRSAKGGGVAVGDGEIEDVC